MEEFQLYFCTMPKLLFAHRFGSKQYDMVFQNVRQNMEITYVLQGGCDICFLDNGEKCTVPPCSMLCSLFERPKRITAKTYHEHITIGFSVDYVHTTEGGLRLPQVLSFGKEENPLLPSMEQLILQYTIDADAPQNMGLLYEILGRLSVLHLSAQKKQTMGQEWYIKKAQRFIVDNISLPFRVTDVAAHLNISPGYLSHLFHQYLGQTVIEYANQVRVRRIEELVLGYGMDIRQAGNQVGLSDPNYVSRLFQKVRGCSLSELRRTRYHHPDVKE